MSDPVSAEDFIAENLRILDKKQIALLNGIFEPIRTGMGGWPIWGYVQHHYEAAFPKETAARVLSTLPSIRPSYEGSSQYGLVWRSDRNTPEPRRDEKVGLSIAGFAYLAAAHPGPERIANQLVTLLSDIAAMEQRNKVTPAEIEERDFPLDPLLRDLDRMTRESPIVFPVATVGELLLREYSNPVSVSERGDQWVLHLVGQRMRRYVGLETVKDYFELIAELDLEYHPGQPVVPPLLPPALYDSGSNGDAEWRELDTSIARLIAKVESSKSVPEWKEVGLACVDILTRVGNLAANVEYVPKDVEALKDDDAQNWIKYFLIAKGARQEVRPLMNKAWELAQNVKHGRNLSATDSFAAAQATILIARVIQRAQMD